MYKEIKGDLISLAEEGNFQVIAHGCNCFCKQKSGIAKQFSEKYDTSNPLIYTLEDVDYQGDINKLGCIQFNVWSGKPFVVNCYTQYRYGKNHSNGDETPINYTALRMCMQKLNHKFKGKKIGLPQIGAGLAGGDWDIIREIIKEELSQDCDVTVVIYNKNK